MIEKEVAIPTADGVSDGFLYQPAAEGRWPGVLHYTDIGGIRKSQCDMARRLAAEGYVVLVPNLLYRTAKPPVLDRALLSTEELFMKRFRELTAPLTPDAAERDATAYVNFLASQEATAGTRMGVVGYCFAGALALRTAAVRGDKIGAAASFHGGGLFTDKPDSPHTVLPGIKAQLYFGHAIQDRSMPQEAIEKLEAALQAWGGAYASETYEGAKHGWTVADSPIYNQPQAERAYKELTELFKRALK
ncbi:MAG TPA: dienelactone hydrolase family protein [Candidatus Angelobacter sp.]|nr:dienelactone hydrolase family protein [Candidatus Angelobacter sp.]